MSDYWSVFEGSIFKNLGNADIEHVNNEGLHTYHEACLRLLGSLYTTEVGVTYAKEVRPASGIIKFCAFSLRSKNVKTVNTAVNVLMTHLVKAEDDLENVTGDLVAAVLQAVERLPKITTPSTLQTLLLVELRIIYKNDSTLAGVLDFKDKFIRAHKAAKARMEDNPEVEGLIDDLLSLIGEAMPHDHHHFGDCDGH